MIDFWLPPACAFFGFALTALSGFGAGEAGPSEVLVDRTTGSVIGNMTDGGAQSNAFDGNVNQALSGGVGPVPFRSGARGHIGKDYSTPGAKKFARFRLYGANDQGFVFNVNGSTTLKIYAKNGSPSNGTDGTLIGSVTFTDTANATVRDITSTDLTTAYTHVWVYVDNGGDTASTCVAEFEMWELI